MHPSYADWLRRAVPTEVTFRTKLSELRRIESVYGDIDSMYDQDELEGLIGELTYTSEDERTGAPNRSKLVIDGDIRNNLASYKSAVRKYARFRQDVELEASRPAFEGRPAIVPLVPELDEQTFTLEADLQRALRKSIAQLEVGLEIADGGAEKSVSSGRIDILARDEAGRFVVIELKAVKAPRDAISQVLAYMGDIQAETDGEVRGILVAPEFDPRAISAARVVPSLRLFIYSFNFSFSPQS